MDYKSFERFILPLLHSSIPKNDFTVKKGERDICLKIDELFPSGSTIWASGRLMLMPIANHPRVLWKNE